ncbi:MAG: site-specific DNA-methyltransferase, partial [Firmicutes bacterium]|nr:site-specific DNA-methyltransferase [Bacillota bacterium]
GIGQYLSMLTSRLYLIRDLLADQGTVWVHLDWHAVHYVRLLMDEIFGADHFVNEIVWTYKSGGASKKHFARKHDTILVYSKSKKYYFQPLKEKSYNRGYKPYHFKGVEEFQDELGWYTMVNMKDVWHIDMVGRTSHERTGYATQKPEAILERIMESCTREGDICADFFCGSGTLAAAAQRMNRRWICCDQGKLAVSTTYRRVADMNDANGQEYCILTEDCSTGNLSAELKDGVITFRECDVQLDYSALEGKDLPELKSAAETDPLLLIDSWSVDWDFDGEIHRPKIINFRKKGKLDLSVQLPEDQEIKCCSVAAYDMLGGRYQTVIKL